jgi:hypothetical protein
MPLDLQHDDIQPQAGRLDPLRAASVGDNQLRLRQGQAVSKLVGLPPSVDQGRDCARLQRGHVADDPARAIAHRDRHPVALNDAARDQRLGETRGVYVEIGEGQPLVARDHGFDLPVELAEDVEQHRQGRRQVGDDCASLAVLADLNLAIAGAVTAASTASNFLSSSLGMRPSAPFRAPL